MQNREHFPGTCELYPRAMHFCITVNDLVAAGSSMLSLYMDNYERSSYELIRLYVTSVAKRGDVTILQP